MKLSGGLFLISQWSVGNEKFNQWLPMWCGTYDKSALCALTEVEKVKLMRRWQHE